MENMMIIGRPRVQASGDCVRLVATVSVSDKGLDFPREVFYEVDRAYEDFLVPERCDAFLVGLIPTILELGVRCRCEAPVSKQLLHNLRYRLSNVLPDFEGAHWPMLEVEAEPDETTFAGGHIGAGCSCGVDSCSTIAVYSAADTPKNLKIDSLAFFDVGSHGVGRTEASKRLAEQMYIERLRRISTFASEMGMPLLTVSSNIQFFGMGLGHVAVDTFRNASAVLALGKWFSVYHCASSRKVTLFRFSLHDISGSDLYVLECLSTESTRFYSGMGAYDRHERYQFLRNCRPAQKYLDVCVERVGNCLGCSKCIRTMFQLEAAGMLDLFSEAFDVPGFRAMPWKTLLLVAQDIRAHEEYLAQMREIRATSTVWTLPFPFWVYRLSIAIYRARKVSSRLTRWFKREILGRKSKGRHC